MRASRPLSLLLLLLLTLALVPAVFATSYTNTVQAAFIGGNPACMPLFHYTTGGVSSASSFEPYPVSNTADSGSVLYGEAYDYHAGCNTSTLQYSAVPLTYGLVGYWPLQEGSGTSAFDLSHNNDTGTLVNSPTWSSTGGPFAGTGYLKFTRLTSTGVSQYVNIIPKGPLASMTNNFSIIAWINESSVNSGFGGGLGSFDYNDGAYRASAIYFASPTQINFVSSYNGSSTTQVSLPYAFEATNENHFQMIVAEFLNGAIEIYDNKTLVNSVDVQYSTLIAPQKYFTIGAYNDNVGYNESIAFASIGPWLTASEVSELYASTQPVLEHQITSPSNTYTFDYYKQTPQTVDNGTYFYTLGQKMLSNLTGTYWVDAGETKGYNTATVSYSISGGGTPTAPGFNFLFGGTAYTYTMTTTATGVFVDPGSAWSVSPNPLTGSGSTERWETNAVISGTATTSITVSPVYYNQYGPDVAFTLTDSYTLKNAPIFTYVLYGQTATATMSKTATQIWMDSGSKWSAQSPFVTNPDLTTYYGNVTSGTVSGATHITEAYTTAKSCVGSTPLISLEHGCVVSAILGTWGNFFGQQIWLSFVLLGVNVAIFNKTQSIMIALSLLMVVGAVFGFAFPAAFASIAEALAAIALAGIVTKAVLMIR